MIMKGISLSFSQYALKIITKYEDGPLSFSQYILTNTNDKIDNFTKEKVWLRPINCLFLITK